VDQHLQSRLGVDGGEPKPRPWAWLVALGALVLGVGLACGVGYKSDITIEKLAASRSPHKLLVQYLQLTSADPAACDTMRSDGLALRFIDGAVLRKLNRAFDAGLIPIDRWQACTLHMWRGMDPVVERSLQRALLTQLSDLVRHPDLGTDGHVRARGYAVLRVLTGRMSTTSIATDRVAKLRAQVVSRTVDLGHSDRATTLLDRLKVALDLEAGLVDGAVLTAKQIASTVDDRLLLTWAERSPNTTLRRLAGHRLVERRVETSAFASVRGSLAEVRERIAKYGHNPVSVDAAVRSTSWSPGVDDAVMLRLLQDYKKRRTKLIPSAIDETRTPDPSVDLRGSLEIVVEGLEKPITLCPSADPWDPTPCWPADRLALIHSVASLAPTGRIRFDRELSLDEVLKLGSDGDRLSAQVVVGDVVQNIDLPIFFDSVPEMVHQGRASVVAHMDVHVWELSHRRLLIEVGGVGARRVWRALVPMDDAAFRIVSYGHVGEPAGDIRVHVECTHCDDVRAWLKARCRSVAVYRSSNGTVSVHVVR
jgi:hypothetical protein